jgi:hypothetical protein
MRKISIFCSRLRWSFEANNLHSYRKSAYLANKCKFVKTTVIESIDYRLLSQQSIFHQSIKWKNSLWDVTWWKIRSFEFTNVWLQDVRDWLSWKRKKQDDKTSLNRYINRLWDQKSMKNLWRKIKLYSTRRLF